MGVQFKEILPRKEIGLKNLSGKKIAIDAYNWIYQFLSIIRDRQTGEPLMDSKGRVTSHLSGIFYRTAKLMEAGIKPIYVFDGKPPDFKFVISERIEIRKQAKKKWKKALKKGDLEEIRKSAQQASRLTEDMVENSKELLKYMGLPAIQAPSEGEAQCAFLCKKKKVFATASQDFDSLLFGSSRLIRNLSITGKRKLPGKNVYIDINPEIIELKDVLKKLKINRNQLIIIGILIGTDYNPGIKGLGPKKSLELVKKEKNLKNIFKKIEWNSKTSPEKIYNFYLKPPTKEVELKFKNIKSEKILKLLVDEYDFSQDRIEKVLKNLKKEQTSLGSWLK
ncbi:MAG: flap endonuclease-1 [Candidatus Aenigmatarchaeota archaeon]